MSKLPESLGIKALGRHRMIFFYQLPDGDKIALEPKDHTRNTMVAMAGRNAAYLSVHWPRQRLINDSWIVTGFEADAAADAFMRACAEESLSRVVADEYLAEIANGQIRGWL